MIAQVRSLGWRWDKPKCILWADVTLTDGQSVSIGLPLAHVVATFDACAAEVGLTCPPLVGAVESVDGLFSSIKKVAKGAVKLASKAVKTTTKVLSKGVAVAAAVAKSKYTSYALMAVAAVVPAVGAPALAAQMAAKRALEMYEDAKKAKALIQSGVKTAQTIQTVTKGGNVMLAVRKLAATNTPAARMATAALRALPAPAATPANRLSPNMFANIRNMALAAQRR